MSGLLTQGAGRTGSEPDPVIPSQTGRMRNFGERLKLFRKQAGLTLDDVAAQLGLTKNAISQWERNVSQPDLANLVALRTMLRVSLAFDTMQRLGAVVANFRARPDAIFANNFQ